MEKTANRQRREDKNPLVQLIKSYVRSNGGAETLKISGVNHRTYNRRNNQPDKYQIGELRCLMAMYHIPKEEILAALDQVLTG